MIKTTLYVLKLILLTFFSSSIQAVIVGLTILKSPDNKKIVYLYHDTHIPHAMNEEQAIWAANVKAQLGDNIKVIAEGGNTSSQSFFKRYYTNEPDQIMAALESFKQRQVKQIDFGLKNNQDMVQDIMLDSYYLSSISNEMISQYKHFLNYFKECSNNVEYIDIRMPLYSFYYSLIEVIDSPFREKAGFNAISCECMQQFVSKFFMNINNIYEPILDINKLILSKIEFILNSSDCWYFDENCKKISTQLYIIQKLLLRLNQILNLSIKHIITQLQKHIDIDCSSGILALHGLAQKSADIMAQSYNPHQKESGCLSAHRKYCLGENADKLINLFEKIILATHRYNSIINVFDIDMVFSILSESKANQIIVYAGGAHQESATRILECLGYDVFYHYENHSNYIKEVNCHLQDGDNFKSYLKEKLAKHLKESPETENIATNNTCKLDINSDANIAMATFHIKVNYLKEKYELLAQNLKITTKEELEFPFNCANSLALKKQKTTQKSKPGIAKLFSNLF